MSRVRLYRVTRKIEYEYIVAATSREEAEGVDVDLDDLWPDEGFTTANEITSPEVLHEWADQEPFGDEEVIGGRTCAEILAGDDEEDTGPTDRELEAAGQLNLMTSEAAA